MKNDPLKSKTAEIIIFSFLAMVCLNSAYSTFFQPPSPISSNTQIDETERVSSFRDSFAEFKVSCNASVHLKTSAQRIRLRGLLCKNSSMRKISSISPQDLRKNIDQLIQIKTPDKDFKPTIFMSDNGAGYSTDFITLQNGINEIQIQFSNEKKEFRQTVHIQKTALNEIH